MSSSYNGPGGPGPNAGRIAPATGKRQAGDGEKVQRSRLGRRARLFAVPVPVFVAAIVVVALCVILWLVLAGQSQVLG